MDKAVIAFVGSFALVGYRVREAKKEDDQEKGKPLINNYHTANGSQKNRGPFSSNPHLEQGAHSSIPSML